MVLKECKQNACIYCISSSYVFFLYCTIFYDFLTFSNFFAISFSTMWVYIFSSIVCWVCCAVVVNWVKRSFSKEKKVFREVVYDFNSLPPLLSVFLQTKEFFWPGHVSIQTLHYYSGYKCFLLTLFYFFLFSLRVSLFPFIFLCVSSFSCKKLVSCMRKHLSKDSNLRHCSCSTDTEQKRTGRKWEKKNWCYITYCGP